MKVFIFDAARCNGCFNCQLACKDEHVDNEWLPYAKPQPDIGHFWLKVDQVVHGQVPKVKLEYKVSLCNHCEEAPCMKVAPDAAYRREDGLVIVDPVKSAGRKDLVDACPFGAIYYNEALDIPQKCTGCAHLVDDGKLPRCVGMCPTEALRFGDEAEFAEEIAMASRSENGRLYGGNVYYLNEPKLFIAGDVWDEEANEIIEGADILLYKDGELVGQTASDDLGDFWFKGLDTGTYDVVVKCAGFGEMEKRGIDLDKSLNIGDFPMHRTA